jgi:DNA-binding NtrC family response regulator
MIGPSRTPRKILIVDDEKAIADSLAMVLSTRNYEARVAYSAEEAIEILAAWQPEVAVLDVILPRMNGIDLGIVVRENYPHCNVLLFSGQPDAHLILEEALKKGHTFDILAKPVPPALMLDAISNLLGSGQEWVE